MTTENYDEKIHQLLKTNLSLEYSIAGRANVQDILDGDTDFDDAEVGSFMDLGTTLALLSTIIGALQLALQIYDSLSDRKAEPSTETIIVEIKKAQPDSAKLLLDEKYSNLLPQLLEQIEADEQ